jgi:hypothetical protein
MSDLDPAATDLRAGLIEGLRAARAAERDILAGLDPAARERNAPDGGWSPKDIQAHLSAWKRRQVDRLAASREGREEPALAATETDDINAIFHAERADWTWAKVDADADTTTADLIAEVEAADADTLADGQVAGSIMGNGPEHTLAHLPPVAAMAGKDATLTDLASRIGSLIDGGDWPSRPAAYARYNLACFYALRGDVDHARALLRLALPEQETLREFAPQDDDLIALRDEIPALIGG